MAKEYLGAHFDIHGGGADLQFPHHQNELAQSEAAFGSKFVNYWIHVGFVQIDNTKMSKSLGNFFTVREVLKFYDWEVLRFFILSSHYRSPLNYSAENLENAKSALVRFYTSLNGLQEDRQKLILPENDFVQTFYNAMNDDFNTPLAISVLFDLVRHINNLRKENNLEEATKNASILRFLGGHLGILQQNPEDFLRGGIGDILTEQEIAEKISARNIARKEKNWALSDKIRNELFAKGIILEDSVSATTWKKA